MTLGDDGERKRIEEELDANLLVEASAGSGKTTALVKRMLALIATGVPVENIAAVTFTRRAADELRERFQNGLEAEFRAASKAKTDVSLYEAALRDLPRAFTGTIHAFCARLLRERPIEIGLDPRFFEVTEAEWEEYKESFWNGWLEHVSVSDDKTLAGLHAVGIEPRWLAEAFVKYAEYADVRFESTETPAPDIGDCRRELEALLDRAWRLIPKHEPADGWDSLMEAAWKLRDNRRATDWSRLIDFCRALTLIPKSKCKVTQQRWGDDKPTKAAAKELSQAFEDWVTAHAEPVLRQWREHRYPIVMRFLDSAAKAFQRERHSAGRLGFTDLLILSAKLLRENPAARDELGRRYSRLLIDEFQDTDPIQAEVCLLLSSESSQGNDWREVVPRSGGLFVVGDPKQSIYRFRRADIETYNVVRRRFVRFGHVLPLNSNFRSTKPIETFVNAHFSVVLPKKATSSQAAFSPMVVEKKAGRVDGVFRYTVTPSENKNDVLFKEDASLLAAWIARRIETGERKASDFLILTQTRAPLETYARALAQREIAIDVGGAELLKEYELHELLVVLRALADPDNGVAVAAALEGLFFGLSPADLFEAYQLGHSFTVTSRPNEAETAGGRALSMLHDWWTMSRRHPADVVVDRILDETGLLAHAAGEPIGESRAGALLYLVDELRAAEGSSASTMSGAIARIEALLRQESDDTPLRLGRTDAVRLMNVHRAKGLESDVVILAAPANSKAYPPDLHVSRTERNEALGWMQVLNSTTKYSPEVLAQPPEWEAMAATELEFVEAERLRLLYVAATRAKHELVVARAVKGKGFDESQWSKLTAALNAHAKELSLKPSVAPERSAPERTRDDVMRAIEAATARVRDASRPTIRSTTVTRSARADEEIALEYDVPREPGLGAAWGRAVHLSIEAMGRGLRGPDLADCVAAIARSEGVEAERVLATLERVRALPDWPRLSAFELPIMRVTTDADGTEVITEGVIDAVAHDNNGWTVIDWKTDVVEGDEWARRAASYEKQVSAYAEMLAALTAEPASARIERVRDDVQR